MLRLEVTPTPEGYSVTGALRARLQNGTDALRGVQRKKYIEKDAALERRFQPVLVGEPTVDSRTGIRFSRWRRLSFGWEIAGVGISSDYPSSRV
jgi:hypothetical protein